ncbi:MAG: hypothetical protein AAF989_03380 [Planctomycetota bacterium]
MFSTQKYIAIVLIAALLVGNVAGWLHVGCTHNSSACCLDDPCSDIACADIECAEIKSTEVEASTSSCEHCDHHLASTPSASLPPSDLADANDSPSDAPLPADHDHDQCTICQGFLSTRHAVVATVSTQVHDVINVELAAGPIDSHCISQPTVGCTAIRGPPQVEPTCRV